MSPPKTPARLLMALLGGVLLAGAFPPYSLSLFAWVGLAPVVMAALRAKRRVAFFAGLLHGFAFYLTSIPWIYTVQREHGGLGPVAAVGPLLALIFYLSLYPAAFAVIVAHISRHSVGRACLAVPFAWVATEFALVHFPDLAFPWNLTGYAVSGNLGLVQLTALTGIYGLSFAVAAFSAAVAWVWETEPARRKRAIAAATGFALVLALVAGFGGRLLPTATSRYVAHLVQLNLTPEPLTDEERARDLDELGKITVEAAAARPGLVVWSEVPAPFSLLDKKFAERVQRIARESQSHFLLGVIGWKPSEGRWRGPYNSAAMLGSSGAVEFTYDKIHLVPFGEYVPWSWLLGFAGRVTEQVGRFAEGSEYRMGQLPDVPGPAEFRTPGPPRKFAVVICFEAVFPGQVRKFVAGGAELLVNLSNDGWYGRTAAPEQHLMMARVRAVENRRWLLRATNNGHTVVVDPYGRIVARLEIDRRAVLDAPYDFRNERTLYTRWGDWLPWLCVLVTFAGFAMGWRRTKQDVVEVMKS